jgi:hypothetical protein
MQSGYAYRPIRDSLRVVRAIATNQLARVWPRAYMRLTSETGRGPESAGDSAQETARYFMSCVHEYMDILGVARGDMSTYWKGRRLLEYGPGDVPGVALLLVGLGAQSVLCVDRFQLVRFDEYQQQVIAELCKLLPDDAARERLRACFREPGNFASGLTDGAVSYFVTQSGLINRAGIVDMVLSRAVLEHVDDLPGTFRDMSLALVSGGLAVHKVDLRSHGLHRTNRLDFLTWPDWLWRLMFSGKGVPNRVRVDRYRIEAPRAGLVVEKIEVCERATPEEVAQIHPHLAREFVNITKEDLAWLSFWMVCRRS